MRGKEKFELWKQYFRDLLDETGQAYARGASLDDAQKQLAKVLIPKYADKFDPGFPKSVIGNIAKSLPGHRLHELTLRAGRRSAV